MKKTLVIFLTVVLTLVFSMPAMALVHWKNEKGQEVSMDGVVVVPMYYTFEDNPDGEEDDTKLTFTEWGWSRFTTTLTSGPISGTWQIGIQGGKPVNEDGDAVKNLVGTRLFSGTWTISEGMTLSMGKMVSPYYFWGSGRLNSDCGLNGYGSNYDDLDPQVVFMKDGLYIDLKENTGTDTVDGFTYDDHDALIPRVYVGYNGSVGPASIVTALGGQTFKVKNATFDDSINSWIASAYASIPVGNLTIRAGGIYGSNIATMNYSTPSEQGVVISGTDVKYTTSYAFMGQVAIPVGSMTLQAGGGYHADDNDSAAWSHKDDRYTVYAHAEIPVFKHESGANVTIWPGIAYFDQMKGKDGYKEAKSTYIGAVLQLSF